MRFNHPDELHAFIGSVIAKLEADGEDTAAEILRAPHTTAFTSGSEWLGETGAAVRRVQMECAISGDANARLEAIMEAVHAVWPRM